LDSPTLKTRIRFSPKLCGFIRKGNGIKVLQPGMWKQKNIICFRFHIPTLCFMKNASGSSKSQMLSSLLPASFFKVLPLPQKFNRFHIPALCFMKNASAFGSSKNQILPRLLPIPASFFKVLPLPQKFNRFCFHIPGYNTPMKVEQKCGGVVSQSALATSSRRKNGCKK